MQAARLKQPIRRDNEIEEPISLYARRKLPVIHKRRSHGQRLVVDKAVHLLSHFLRRANYCCFRRIPGQNHHAQLGEESEAVARAVGRRWHLDEVSEAIELDLSVDRKIKTACPLGL